MAKDKTQVLLENKEVFEETLTEFSSKTYDLASVNEIIKRSQYNKGSFYYRFKDKYELYISLLDYVFVQQIDLFKLTGFSLIDHSDEIDIVKAMLGNLYDLYQLDHRYFYLMQRLLSESKDFIDKAFKSSVGSIYQRFIQKLKTSHNVSQEQLYIIESIYKNLDIEKIELGHLSIDNIISILFIKDIKSVSQSIVQSNDLGFFTQLNQPINYLIVSEKDYVLSSALYNLLISSQDILKIKRRLKLRSLMVRFDLRKILIKNRFKPLFNKIGVDILLEEVYDEIKEDKILFPILLTLVYAILDLKQYILIDKLLHFLGDRQKNILFKYILPINGQLSKIVLIEERLYFNTFFNFDSFYYFDEFLGLKNYHISSFKDQYQHKFYCEYKIDEQFHNLYFDCLDDFIKFKQNNNISVVHIEVINELSIDKIREEVSQ